jgi:hypothetical protein
VLLWTVSCPVQVGGARRGPVGMGVVVSYEYLLSVILCSNYVTCTVRQRLFLFVGVRWFAVQSAPRRGSPDCFQQCRKPDCTASHAQWLAGRVTKVMCLRSLCDVLCEVLCDVLRGVLGEVLCVCSAAGTNVVSREEIPLVPVFLSGGQAAVSGRLRVCCTLCQCAGLVCQCTVPASAPLSKG